MKFSIPLNFSVTRPAWKINGLCLAAMLALAGANVRAQLISSEAFSGYTVGTQLPANTPSPAVPGYTGDWTSVDWGDGHPQSIAGSLSYSGAGYAAGSGDHIGVPYDAGGINQSTSGRMYRLLDNSLVVNSSTTGTRYLSWLFQSGQESGAGTAYQMLELYNGSTADSARTFSGGLCANGGNPGNFYDFQVNTAGTPTGSGVAADTGVHLFVVKFDLSATAGADSVTVWVDPALGAGEPAGGTVISAQDIAFDRLAISDYDGNSANWDEIRWGSTFDSVTITSPPTMATVTAVANPTSGSANQSFTITATETPGSGTVTNVVVDLSPIGGSASAPLVLSDVGTYTNTFTISGAATVGTKNLQVSATDTTPLTGSYLLAFTVLPSSRTWDGGSAIDSKWSSVTNWVLEAPPLFPSDSVTFAGTTRLTPDMDTNYTIVGLTFDSTAGSFNISSSNGSTLTNGVGGITNSSANAQVLNVPIVLSAAQTFDAEGNITFSNLITGGQTILKTGAGTLTFAGPGSGTNVFGDFQATAGFLEVASPILVNDTSGANSRISGCNMDIAAGGALTVVNAGTSWFPIGDDSSTTTTCTISGGSLNVVNLYGLQIARNGDGTLTLNSGSVLVNDSTSSGLSLSEGGGNSEVDLNGGRLSMIRLHANGGTEAFNFNGGTLSPTASSADFIPGSTALTLNVRNGGAVVDTAGYDVTISQPLVHSTIGGDNATDGGLIKTGNGTLTLSVPNTYTGNTVVSGGTLVAGDSSVVRSSSPVLHLSFDNVSGTTVTNDGIGGSAMNGTLNGSATIVSGGRFGNCLSISGADASSASCRIASSVVPLNVGAGSAWTVAMWIQSSTPGGAYAYQGDGGWAGNYPTAGDTSFYLTDNQGAGSYAGAVRWGQGWEEGSTAISDGAWHHVVMTCDGTTKALYVDGNPDTLIRDVWSTEGLGGQFWIGGSGDTGDGSANLNGLVDEVYVFNRAISATDVQSLYNSNSISATSLPGTQIVPGAVTVASGATLAGNGTVGGAVTVQPGGTISAGSAGASIGTLTISNNLTLGGNVVAVVNTSVSPSNSVIAVSGTLANTGTGTITISNLGPALVAGNSFTLFSKPLANGGAMSIATVPALASGLVFSNRLALDGSVLVVTAGPGGPEQLTNSYNAGTHTLSLSWPEGQGWRLQMQTNNLSNGLGTNWTYVTDGSINSTNITVDPAKPTVFYRLVYP